MISLTGDWMLRVGLTYEVYKLTGSTLASGVLLATSLVPQLALGSLAGVFVDRWSRRSVMIVVDVLLAAALLPLLAVRSVDDVWIVYPVSFAAAVLIQFLTPAEAAMAPLLVAEERLVTANALIAQSRDAARLVGSALGGVLAGAGGIALVGGADIASFLAAAGAVVFGALATVGGAAALVGIVIGSTLPSHFGIVPSCASMPPATSGVDCSCSSSFVAARSAEPMRQGRALRRSRWMPPALAAGRRERRPERAHFEDVRPERTPTRARRGAPSRSAPSRSSFLDPAARQNGGQHDGSDGPTDEVAEQRARRDEKPEAEEPV